MDEKDDLLNKVRAIPYWYHKIELPYGIVTPGWAPINPLAYRIPDTFDGKRVLDLGAWDGYWTFEALKRGAKEVVAIDDFSDYLGSLEKSQRMAWEPFDLCSAALGYSEDRCKRICQSTISLKGPLDFLISSSSMVRRYHLLLRPVFF